MAVTPPLALSNIIDITVTVSPTAPAVNSFNVGLFVGPSTIIPSYGANSRVQLFTSTSAMQLAGFTTSSPEYIAAQIYFSQSPAAAQFAVGRQDLTAIGTVVLDGRTVNDGAMSSVTNPTFLTSATAAFVSGDVGTPVIVAGAGVAGAALVTTVASVTSGTVAVLAAPATTTVTTAQTSVGYVGEGFDVGDQFNIVQGSANYGVGQALTVGSTGQILTFSVPTQGTGYSMANGLTCTAISPSTGNGLKVDITAIGESLLQAATACRIASGAWYGLTVNAPADADNIAISEWADPLWQSTRYYPYSNSAGIPAGTANNVALQLQTLSLRVLGQYATTQGGLFPNNVYAAVALMGVEMGLNTGLAGSFFTVAHKTLVGIAPEPLSQTQYANILSAGFNVFGNFQNFELEEPGFMSNGSPSYLWLNLAMLVAQIQSAEMAVLQSEAAVPQTNAGEHLLIQAANSACTFMANIGFLAGNTWQGASINITGLSITNGQALPSGFLNLSQPYSQQLTADRDAGKAMPIYTFITTAGAVQSLTIGVFVQL